VLLLTRVERDSHTEETSKDIEGAELNEAWDLNTAEDVPTECLMVLSRPSLVDRKLQ
jgi:hypothetical protein